MNKILHLCGQHRVLSNIFKSTNLAKNAKSAIWYKPIEISYRYFSQQLKVPRAPLNIDPATIVKDIIVYKYENPKYFKYMNIFGIVQFAMLSYYSQFTAITLRDVPVDKTSENYENLPWYSKMNIGNTNFRYWLSIACFTIGEILLECFPTFCTIWFFGLLTFCVPIALL